MLLLHANCRCEAGACVHVRDVGVKTVGPSVTVFVPAMLAGWLLARDLPASGWTATSESTKVGKIMTVNAIVTGFIRAKAVGAVRLSERMTISRSNF